MTCPVIGLSNKLKPATHAGPPPSVPFATATASSAPHANEASDVSGLLRIAIASSLTDTPPARPYPPHRSPPRPLARPSNDRGQLSGVGWRRKKSDSSAKTIRFVCDKIYSGSERGGETSQQYQWDLCRDRGQRQIVYRGLSVPQALRSAPAAGRSISWFNTRRQHTTYIRTAR